MELITGLIIAVITFAAGLFIGKIASPNSRRIKELEASIEEGKQQHQTYKDKVAVHFSESANLFTDITEKYRSLYYHLSSGANDLCDRRNIPRELASSHVNLLAVESPEIAHKLNGHGVPIIPENDLDSESMAKDSAQELLNQNKIETTNSADIIDLDSQRSDKTVENTAQQAKDYAIKAKGVINHNSLNRDDVKT